MVSVIRIQLIRSAGKWDGNLYHLIRRLSQISFLLSLKSVFLYSSSHQWCFMKKGVFRNFVKFTGKHQCQSLIFSLFVGLTGKRPCYSAYKDRQLFLPIIPETYDKLIKFFGIRSIFSSPLSSVYAKFFNIKER